ncbi:multiple epidermal growth factor-like domains protein 6 isoform X10 [Haliotis rufescens]|uniref:multiple epidermal growth factor-like domains protein 6 isoform X10 n=1 Tax=Haliotis rufescens TaxID=6454 RepID=UPI00201EE281|nr:multiple epidermal growth factor-like domains protein 6 isoform X10 [Haliotis rufescens]
MDVWVICVILSWITIIGLPDVESNLSLAENSKVLDETGKPIKKNVKKIFDEKPKTCVKINGNLNITFADRSFNVIRIVVEPRDITVTVGGTNLHKNCSCETSKIKKKKTNVTLTAVNFTCPLLTSTSLQLLGVNRLCDVQLYNTSGNAAKGLECTEWNQKEENITNKPATTPSACNPGTFGASCTDTCGDGCVNSTCDIREGTCSCLPGWNGSRCDTECPDASYGDYCKGRCSRGCTGPYCNKTDGICRCRPGYNGSTCHDECKNGTYGHYCNESCSEGCSAPCNSANGSCTCKPGYTGSTCVEKCEDRTYGHYCNESCSEGCSAPCNSANGSCTCKSGFTGSTCLEKCEDRTYGHYCNESCSEGCSAPCNSANGSCICKPGYTGPTCVEKCKDRTYGHYCNASCSEGCSAPCNSANGSCICKPGYTGPTCVEKCKNGTYGHYCHESCSEGCTAPCNSANGSCTCKPGYTGSTCVEKCEDRTYGHYCNESCSEGCSAPCNSANGSCTCKSGFTGSTCLEKCEDRTYGHYCNESCSEGCSATCNSANGSCTCKPGFTGSTCLEKCKDGTYGHYCNANCSEGCSTQCNKENGKCSCKPGYRGNKCVRQCKDRTYGHYCNESCSEGCSASCNSANGSCICKPGYRGPTCVEKCEDRTYGHYCNESCSEGCSAPCNSANGSCICKPGYTGPTCVEKCKNGTYGHYCHESCSEGCTAPCNSANGSCTCKPGYTGSTCVEKCEDRTYGHYCNASCSEGCSATCNSANGSCTCKPGFTGSTCLENCKDGTYGHYCNANCSEGCSTQCNKENGKCSCKPGYRGNKCVRQCKDRTYGHYCNESCSEGCSAPCNSANGSCICKPGYRGPTCVEKCEDRTYGHYCNASCSEGCSAPCNSANGSCICKPGYTGPTCVEKCKGGTYGNYCNTNCSDGCSTQCNKENGKCSCKPGYRGNKCVWPCLQIHYGSNCNETCSDGCVNGECDKEDGTCSCRPGWKGNKCTTECPLGFYGDSCNRMCPHCLEKNCSSTDGRCLSSCSAGWRGGKCEKECDQGQFGSNCRSRCSLGCFNSSCTPTDGECNCTAGWEGPKCDRECESGTYGENCTLQCSLGCRFPCHGVSGRCKCRVDWTGPQCQDKIGLRKADFFKSELMFHVVAAFAILVIVVMAAAAFLFLREPFMRWRNGHVINAGDVAAPRRQAGKDDTQETSLSSRNGPSPLKGVPKATTSGGESSKNVSMRGRLFQHKERRVTLKKSLMFEDPTVGQMSDAGCEDDPKDRHKEATTEQDDALAIEENEIYISASRIAVKDFQTYLAQKKSQKKTFDKEYSEFPQGLSASHNVALIPENNVKNRFKGIYPYDHSRVCLKTKSTMGGYINASYINGPSNKRQYIAAQGPLPSTVTDFWEMVWENQCPAIVMLANVMEDGRERCHQYWPDKGVSEFGDWSITCLDICQLADLTIRTLSVQRKHGVSKQVKHIHYTVWPDKDVPKYPMSLVMLRNTVREFCDFDKGPTVVHCSAGVGRTGTLISLDYLLQEAEEQGSVDVYACVWKLRTQRLKMVQTKVQYVFLHDCVLDALAYTTPAVTTAEFGNVYKQQQRDTDGNNGMAARFEKLNSCPGPAVTATVARYAENIQKNRRQSLYPDDSDRPLLTTEVEGQTDYINAVFVPSYKKQRAFILTQAPMPSTVVDIWRLIHDYRISGIVVLDDYKENASGDCAVYWAEEGKPGNYGPFAVSFIKRQNHPGFRTEVYKYSMKGTNETREITLFRADSWKSTDLPRSSVHFLTLLDYIRQWNSSTAPILVQCRDGATRCGLFSVVSSIQEHVLTAQLVSVDRAIRTTRNVRPQVIPTMEQYRFCHDIMMEYLRGPWKGK